MTLDRKAADGVPVDRGFVQFLTSAVNREGKRTIEFDESYSVMLELRFPITECQVDGPSSCEDELRHTAERKTKVSRTGWEDSQEAPSERVG